MTDPTGPGQDPQPAYGQQPGPGQQPPAAYQPPPSYQPPPPPDQQPGYAAQPQQFGQPMGPVTTQFARLDPGPSQKFGAMSFILTLIGTALTVVAFTAVDWFDGGSSSSFSNVHKVINAAKIVGVGSPPIARAYFSWLGWVLLAAAVIFALFAATPTFSGPFRVGGVVIAAASIALTFIAIKVFKDSSVLGSAYTGYWSYLKHARFGFYLAVAGFALIGIGSAIGPARER